MSYGKAQDDENEPKFHIKISSYSVVNTLAPHKLSVKAVYGNRCCVFWEKKKTEIQYVGKCTIFLTYINQPLGGLIS
jgi:hypothetical protein